MIFTVLEMTELRLGQFLIFDSDGCRNRGRPWSRGGLADGALDAEVADGDA